MITANQLKQILPRCRDPEFWAFELAATLPEHGIDTKEQIASFLSQVGHESADLNILQENLNYSQQALRRVFGKYFPDDKIAYRYARQPKWIASRVYANRMGNGGEQSMDGWKYRGRGLIQITGKNNYTRCSRDMFGDDRLVENPDLVLEKPIALMTAYWYWQMMKLEQYGGDVKKVTKLVNGGYHGLSSRQEIFDRAMNVL